MIPSNDEVVKEETNYGDEVVAEVKEETTPEQDANPDDPRPTGDVPVASTKAESNDSKVGLPPLGKAPSFAEVYF